jgi:hypothetical protein|uniref:Uncharacterized protein n=1 Tax=Oryza nivara TaxID=4536 RepID=A0A0E0J3C9_ORYNI
MDARRRRLGKEQPRSTPAMASREGAASIRAYGGGRGRSRLDPLWRRCRGRAGEGDTVGRGKGRRRSDGEERAAPHRCVRWGRREANQ